MLLVLLVLLVLTLGLSLGLGGLSGSAVGTAEDLEVACSYCCCWLAMRTCEMERRIGGHVTYGEER